MSAAPAQISSVAVRPCNSEIALNGPFAADGEIRRHLPRVGRAFARGQYFGAVPFGVAALFAVNYGAQTGKTGFSA